MKYRIYHTTKVFNEIRLKKSRIVDVRLEECRSENREEVIVCLKVFMHKVNKLDYVSAVFNSKEEGSKAYNVLVETLMKLGYKPII